ncbi:MAG: Hsp20/alpha crystallin family protein [Sphaerochaetaceae bacterium]|nr:Hsp20/alpha crystallin family protein [Sphaerochaetaceae bacterium]
MNKNKVRYTMNYFNTTNDFDRFFNDVFGTLGVRNNKIPSVDVYEDDKAFYVEAELAGYDMKDVEVNVEKHVLRIASHKIANTDEDRKYLIRERSFVEFDRAFSLPEGINEEAIDAEFKNGVLTITLPKMPVEEPKKISVKIK